MRSTPANSERNGGARCTESNPNWHTAWVSRARGAARNYTLGTLRAFARTSRGSSVSQVAVRVGELQLLRTQRGSERAVRRQPSERLPKPASRRRRLRVGWPRRLWMPRATTNRQEGGFRFRARGPRLSGVPVAGSDDTRFSHHAKSALVVASSRPGPVVAPGVGTAEAMAGATPFAPRPGTCQLFLRARPGGRPRQAAPTYGRLHIHRLTPGSTECERTTTPKSNYNCNVNSR